MTQNDVWECLKCGKCCELFVRTGANVSEEEFLNIKEVVEQNFNLKTIEKIAATYLEIHTFPTVNSNIPRTCIFLQDNLCAIYAVKPSVCKDYPLEVQEVGGKVKIYVSSDCPRGEKIADELRRKLPTWLKNRVRVKGKQIEIHICSFYEEKIKEVYR